MDREYLKQAITDTLGAINEQFSILSAYEDKVPRIELDIIKSNIRELYEYIILFENDRQQDKVPVKTPSGEEPAEEVMPGRSVGNLLQDEAVTGAEMEKPADETPADDPIPKVAREEAPGPDIDLFSGPGSTLADKLQKEEGEILANRMQPEKQGDLRSGIGINEKFMFINELFEGSMREYDEALTAFNECHSQDEAVTLITSLSEKYNWNEDTEALLEFTGLVTRRYQ